MLAAMINVSAASPFGDINRRVTGMIAWTESVLAEARPALVFAQECRADWLGVWEDSEYDVILGDSPGQPQYRAVSALLVDRRVGMTIRQSSLTEIPSLSYHGSYVAAASWSTAVGEVTLMSVHASPTRAEKFLDKWPLGPIPQRRGRKGRTTPGGLWDADVLLTTLRHQASRGEVLAAGDLNEALGWDDVHKDDTWGREFFDAVSKGKLVAPLHEQWNWGRSERPTSRARGRPQLQLDHIIATPRVGSCISQPRIDPGWAEAKEFADWSDHAPVWFNIGPPWAS